jgi:hypothetical protein
MSVGHTLALYDRRSLCGPWFCFFFLFLQHGMVQSVNQHPRSNAITARFPAEAKRAESRSARRIFHCKPRTEQDSTAAAPKDAHAQFKQLEESLPRLMLLDTGRSLHECLDDHCCALW